MWVGRDTVPTYLVQHRSGRPLLLPQRARTCGSNTECKDKCWILQRSCDIDESCQQGTESYVDGKDTGKIDLQFHHSKNDVAHDAEHRLHCTLPQRAGKNVRIRTFGGQQSTSSRHDTNGRLPETMWNELIADVCLKHPHEQATVLSHTTPYICIYIVKANDNQSKICKQSLL